MAICQSWRSLGNQTAGRILVARSETLNAAASLSAPPLFPFAFVCAFETDAALLNFDLIPASRSIEG
jgi:hypothetical protein